MEIKLLNSEWPGEKTEVIQGVLESNLNNFSLTVGRFPDSPIQVINDPTMGHPMASYEKINGGYLIFLSVESGRSWAQISYQFSHELCHILCNHSLAQGHMHKWFEETICETASMYNLRKLSNSWRDSPPFPYMNVYAPSFSSYTDGLLSKEERCLPEGEDFKGWVSEILPILEKDPNQRDLNGVIANRFLPEFEKNPQLWHAIPSLNLWDCSKDETFVGFLSSWKKSAIGALSTNVDDIAGIFGIELNEP